MAETLRNDLADPRLGIGGNLGPALEPVTVELLNEELEGMRDERDALVLLARQAVVLTPEDAAKVHLLAAKVKDLIDEVETKRKDRGEPYRMAVLMINGAHNAIKEPLDGTYQSLRGMLTTFQRKQDEEAAAARRKAEEEARRREQEAAEARARAEQEASTVGDRMEAIQAEEAAQRASERAAAIRPEAIPALTGGVGTRPERRFEITDIRKALGWLLRVNKSAVLEATKELVRRQLNAIPINTFTTTDTPGIEKRIEHTATVRRR